MYPPGEDSLLMVEAVRKLDLRGERALDMGTGSGIIARELAGRFREVVAADIDPEAVERTGKLGGNVKAVLSDLFSNVSGKFDLITFNPPYLPCEGDPELCCGQGKVIERFVREARAHLKPAGRILLLLSSLTPVQIEGVTVARKKLPFEEIRVIVINR